MHFTAREEQSILKAANFPKFVDVNEVKAKYSGCFLRCGTVRHYHDWNHALSVLSWVNHVCEEFPADMSGLTTENHEALRLAALYHDVVYVVKNGSPENEQQSFAVLREHHDSAKAQSNRLIVSAGELIMATSKHGKLESNQVTLPEALFLDCDIASFAEPRWDTVVWNNENVVAELRAVYTDAQINEGRRRFLHGMLTKRSIFLSEYFRSKYEHQARKNIQRLIDETLPYAPA